MNDLLYLVHRIPYPPNKGDKIRSFHLLRHLARRHRVHLGAFVDDPADWAQAPALREWVRGELCLRPLTRPRALLRSLTGFVTGEPLSLPYYRDGPMQRWVEARLAAGVGQVLVYSSSMAPYVLAHDGLRRVIDFVDIDSDKWRQYAARRPWPLSVLYRREAYRLFAFERQVALSFDAATFVSETEAALFCRLAPEVAAHVSAFSNGVDTDYFSPAEAGANPYPAGTQALVFTGAMDYWANVDAVCWFASQVWPSLHARHPAVVFYIVGARPTPAVQALARQPGVVVTGSVPDVRPWLAHAQAAVAPLRIARGIQNKVLEAMAMARATVVSPQALEGIRARPDEEVVVAEGAAEFLARLGELLDDPARATAIGQRARARVLTDYGWDVHLARVDALLTGAQTDSSHQKCEAQV
ncbi:TIGR03087 family PEP-CTERM/XrtA system glycosyltransferase [Thiobacter aerophilum]|uniref:TIGR03087 family PEP-CTERM/XrtA system glycosyltransferase n=1 Tax=Thiobacter aerophilum TaxID=3121275 RepID=A0ABV0EDT5_9BURK